MKKKNIILLPFLFFSYFSFSQSINLAWVKNFGGSQASIGNAVAVDAAGNVYTTGEFKGTVDFDPGPGVFNLSQIGISSAFITKLDGAGNFIWAKQFVSPNIISYSIALDASSNIYTTGFFEQNADFDPGPGIFPLTSSFGSNGFVSKLDKDGNFIWAKQFSGPLNSHCTGYAIALDGANNVFTTGYYSNTIDFDPGTNNFNLTAAGFDDIFISKLDANGNFIWAKQFMGNSFETANAITVNSTGNIYLTGYFQGTVDFDPGTGVNNITSAGNRDIFVAKLGTAGNFIWAKQMGGSLDDLSSSITTDATGNVYTTGSFSGFSDFDPGSGSFNLNSIGTSDTDIFISKLDSTGNFVWVKQIGSNEYDRGLSITSDKTGGIYASGYFYGIADFDSGINAYELSSSGEADIFILKLNSSGGFDWVKKMGGSLNDYATAIAVDANGSIYSTGAFEDVVDFDPGQPVLFLSSKGLTDIFVHKMIVCPNVSSSSITETTCGSYILNNQTYDTSGIFTQIIPNVYGCDSTITLYLTVNKKFMAVNSSICQGQSYFAGGINQTTTGIYKDTLLTSLGCDSIITTNLLVHPKPAPNLGADKNLCLNVPLSVTPGLFTTYLWQDNSTQSNFIINNVGKYWVTVTDTKNCTASDTLKILAIDTIPKNFLPVKGLMCYSGVFDIAVTGYKKYFWSTGAVSNIVSLNNLGTYYLTVTDYNNCVGKDTVILEQDLNCIPVIIPNAFTPNNDGINDIFKPTIKQGIQQYSFIIFNRYGQKVFETGNYSIGWNGSFKGIKQPENSYAYQVIFKNIKGDVIKNKGMVILIR